MNIDHTAVVETTVTALVEPFKVAFADDALGRSYCIGRLARGVRWADLSTGQRLRCVVAGKAPRVLYAEVIS